MKVAILHEELEWSEREFKRTLESKGTEPELFDVRTTDYDDLKKYDLVINRVYASVANRNYSALLKTLDLLSKLEERGVECINSLETSKADYSKKYAIEKRKENGLEVPKTEFLLNLTQAIDFAEELGYPVIIKRDSGGRGKDVQRIDNEEQLRSYVEKIAISDNQYVASGGRYIIQEFLEPAKKNDARVGVLNGSILLSFRRTLVRTEENGQKWLASVSNGSRIIPYEKTPEDIKKVAIEGSKAIDAVYNAVDIALTERGPVIIEDNPTPNFINDPDRPEDTKEDKKNMEKLINGFLGYIKEREKVEIRV